MKLKKSLGQHFINDKNIIYKITSFIPTLNPNCIILEIGAGHGSLTEVLIEKFNRVISVEIDSYWVKTLREKFGQVDGWDIIHSDFLELNLDDLGDKDDELIIVGNIPYYITSPILFKIIESYYKIPFSLLLMQKEVGKRLIARERTKDYGLLSIFIQIFYIPTIVYTIPPEVFVPPPKVESALVQLERRNTPLLPPEEWSEFNYFVRQLFVRRRKTIRNNLKNILNLDSLEHLSSIQYLLQKRAEALSIEELIRFYFMIKKELKR